jgi:hypothetical protein
MTSAAKPGLTPRLGRRPEAAKTGRRLHRLAADSAERGPPRPQQPMALPWVRSVTGLAVADVWHGY